MGREKADGRIGCTAWQAEDGQEGESKVCGNHAHARATSSAEESTACLAERSQPTSEETAGSPVGANHMIDGNTLFLGDSMSVALAPAVQVNGTKRTIAQVSKTSDWLLANVHPSDFQGVQNVVLLIGANDMGGSVSPPKTIQNIKAIEAMVPSGVRFVVMTVPPFKGWSNYASNYSVINARRLQINAAIKSSFPNVVPLDKLLADPSDGEQLSPQADSGDHLHPRPSATAKAIADTWPSFKAPTPAAAPAQGNGLLLGAAVLCGSYLFYRLTR
jgi:lysophospholipase L1-like esterase